MVADGPIGPAGRLRVAVIGSGISGASAAWLLAQSHDVTLIEQSRRLGGHTNTVEIAGLNGDLVAVDTGFIVYNPPAYPNLTALFDHLGVKTEPSDMSFGVSLAGGRFEYGAGSLRSLLAQPANVASPRFWSMVSEIVRFYRTARNLVAEVGSDELTLGGLLDRGHFGAAFRNDHLLPMAGAIWSAPPGTLLDYPAAAFIRFFENHGLLKLQDRPLWRTVTGGSRRYLDAMLRAFGGKLVTSAGTCRVERTGSSVSVVGSGGTIGTFDHAVLATHADEALAALTDASPEERRLLGAFRYTGNRAVLHTDRRFMPRRKAAWSSWNVIETAAGSHNAHAPICVTYWMNLLRPLKNTSDVFVTLNPERITQPEGVLHEDHYTHPVFDLAAMAAQGQLWSLQGQRRTWFCGAYFGSGFHEDGLQSGLAVAEQLGGRLRPWSVAQPSGRIHVSRSAMRHAAEAAS